MLQRPFLAYKQILEANFPAVVEDMEPGPEMHPAGKVPANLQKDLAEATPLVAMSVVSWLRRRKKAVRPQLSEEQKAQMVECFHLMDADGSGAIDADELTNAFELLGMHMSKAEVKQVLDEVDRDGSGEVEYPEFLEIMTSTIQKLADRKEKGEQGAQISFDLLATAYRRKRFMEGLLTGDRELQQQMADIADLKEAEQGTQGQAAAADKGSAGPETSQRPGSHKTKRYWAPELCRKILRALKTAEKSSNDLKESGSDLKTSPNGSGQSAPVGPPSSVSQRRSLTLKMLTTSPELHLQYRQSAKLSPLPSKKRLTASWNNITTIPSAEVSGSTPTLSLSPSPSDGGLCELGRFSHRRDEDEMSPKLWPLKDEPKYWARTSSSSSSLLIPPVDPSSEPSPHSLRAESTSPSSSRRSLDLLKRQVSRSAEFQRSHSAKTLANSVQLSMTLAGNTPGRSFADARKSCDGREISGQGRSSLDGRSPSSRLSSGVWDAQAIQAVVSSGRELVPSKRSEAREIIGRSQGTPTVQYPEDAPLGDKPATGHLASLVLPSLTSNNRVNSPKPRRDLSSTGARASSVDVSKMKDLLAIRMAVENGGRFNSGFCQYGKSVPSPTLSPTSSQERSGDALCGPVPWSASEGPEPEPVPSRTSLDFSPAVRRGRHRPAPRRSISDGHLGSAHGLKRSQAGGTFVTEAEGKGLCPGMMGDLDSLCVDSRRTTKESQRSHKEGDDGGCQVTRRTRSISSEETPDAYLVQLSSAPLTSLPSSGGLSPSRRVSTQNATGYKSRGPLIRSPSRTALFLAPTSGPPGHHKAHP